jgi:ATP-dependent Clp protease ATP-binding subunit ClpA
MFEHFTEGARAVDPQALRAIGIDYKGVRAAVEETFGPGSLEAAADRRVRPGRNGKPPFTPEAKRVLELTLRVARELGHKQITPGHLLLGLLRLDDDFVVKVVEQSGSTPAGLSAAILAAMSTAA